MAEIIEILLVLLVEYKFRIFRMKLTETYFRLTSRLRANFWWYMIKASVNPIKLKKKQKWWTHAACATGKLKTSKSRPLYVGNGPGS